MKLISHCEKFYTILDYAKDFQIRKASEGVTDGFDCGFERLLGNYSDTLHLESEKIFKKYILPNVQPDVHSQDYIYPKNIEK